MFKQRTDELIAARTHMLAVISHELRTPLHSCLFHAQEIAAKHGDSEEIKLLLQGAAQLCALTNDVLDLTKLELAQMEENDGTDDDDAATPSPVRMQHLRDSVKGLVQGAVLRERLAGNEAIASVEEVSINWNVETHQQDIVLDVPRWQQVLLNYVSNAIKYGRPPLTVNVLLTSHVPAASGPRVGRLAPAQQYLLLEVVDSGLMQNVAGLFQPFRAGASQKRLPGKLSLGVGLSVVRLNAFKMRGCAGQFRRSWCENCMFFMVPFTCLLYTSPSPRD